MTICRSEKTKNYSIVQNFIAKDNRLSWKAKGIWFYAMTRPDDWKFYSTDIINQSTDGKDSVLSGLRELEKFGYLKRLRNKDDKGKFVDLEWIFCEVPMEVKILVPQTDFPPLDFPATENPPLPNTEAKPNTEETNSSNTICMSSNSLGTRRPTAAAAAVFSSLKDLDIPEEDKVEISSTYPESIVAAAVGWLRHSETKVTKNAAAALKWACKKKKIPPQSQEIVADENKIISCKMDGLANENNTASVIACHAYIEINFPSSQQQPICIFYDDKDFKKKLKEVFIQYRFRTQVKGA